MTLKVINQIKMLNQMIEQLLKMIISYKFKNEVK